MLLMNRLSFYWNSWLFFDYLRIVELIEVSIKCVHYFRFAECSISLSIHFHSLCCRFFLSAKWIRAINKVDTGIWIHWLNDFTLIKTKFQFSSKNFKLYSTIIVISALILICVWFWNATENDIFNWHWIH